MGLNSRASDVDVRNSTFYGGQTVDMGRSSTALEMEKTYDYFCHRKRSRLLEMTVITRIFKYLLSPKIQTKPDLEENSPPRHHFYEKKVLLKFIAKSLMKQCDAKCVLHDLNPSKYISLPQNNQYL